MKTTRSLQKVERTSYDMDIITIIFYLYYYFYIGTRIQYENVYYRKVCTCAHILQNKIHSSLRSESKKNIYSKVEFVCCTYLRRILYRDNIYNITVVFFR